MTSHRQNRMEKKSMGKNMFRVVMCTSLVLAAMYSLRAQTVSGTILGLIQDQQGAVVAKTEVTARNLETGAVRKTTADDNGAYRIFSIPAGPYEVSASAAGFKTEVRTGIAVTVGSDISVNFSLTIGAISEQVQVTAEAAQVDASSSTLAGFVNSTTIRELPLNGRDWLQLSLLQPGVNANAAQNSNDLSRAQRGNGMALYISGGRHTDNAFRIDGVIVNDYANGGPGSSLRVNLGVDAIREFSVLTNNYSADDTLSANAQQGILCANADCTQTEQVDINPKVKPFITLYPIPNGPVNGNSGKFLFSPKRDGQERYVTGKIDHSFSGSTTFF